MGLFAGIFGSFGSSGSKKVQATAQGDSSAKKTVGPTQKTSSVAGVSNVASSSAGASSSSSQIVTRSLPKANWIKGPGTYIIKEPDGTDFVIKVLDKDVENAKKFVQVLVDLGVINKPNNIEIESGVINMLFKYDYSKHVEYEEKNRFFIVKDDDGLIILSNLILLTEVKQLDGNKFDAHVKFPGGMEIPDNELNQLTDHLVKNGVEIL